MRFHRAILVFAAVVALVGCDSDDTSQDAEAGEAQQADEQAEDDAVLPPLEGPFDGAHDPSEPVGAEELGDRLVDSVCLAYDHCRNEQLKAVVFRTMLTSAIEHQSEADDDHQDEVYQQRLVDLRDGDQLVPDREACGDVFGPVLLEGGLDGEALGERVEAGTVEYDADEAARCLAQFGEPFDACSKDRPLGDGPPDVEHVMGTMMSHQEELDEHFEACGQMLAGTLTDGEECRFNYECAGQLTCGEEVGDEPRRCGEPQGIGDSMAPGALPSGEQPPGPGEQPVDPADDTHNLQ